MIDVAGELHEDAQLVIVPGGGWRDGDGDLVTCGGPVLTVAGPAGEPAAQ